MAGLFLIRPAQGSEMKHQLLLLRHGKSDWKTGAGSDLERPLGKRGHRQAARLGKWMKDHDIVPARIISSPALRARQTTEHICEGLDVSLKTIRWDLQLYMANCETLLETARVTFEEADSILLVGHNPGLEMMLEFLGGRELPLNHNGKLLATSNMAQIAVPEGNLGLKRKSCELIRIIRPADTK